jgi:hypothetical protein
MVVAPYGLIDSARILVESLIVQREHLSLLLILLGSLILASICLLIAPIVTLKHFIFLILLIIFFIEKRKVIWIFTFTIGRICIVFCVVGVDAFFFNHQIIIIILLLFRVCWRSLSVTDALVALITNEYSVPRIRILMIGKGSSTTNVVRILMARMA